MNDTDQLMKAYFDLCMFDNRADFWAWEELDEMSHERPEECLSTIITFLKHAPNAKVASSIGTGPLEDVLLYHGPLLLERLRQELQVNKRLRFALSKVHFSQMKIEHELKSIMSAMKANSQLGEFE